MLLPFRFIGSEVSIGDVKLERFGTRVNLEEKFAAVAIKGGAALISEQEFTKLGFTQEDLKVWADPFMPELDLPPDPEEAERKLAFLDRKRKAQAIYIEARHKMLDSPPTDFGPISKPVLVSLGAPVDVVEVVPDEE
jgi:hypothetical protein